MPDGDENSSGAAAPPFDPAVLLALAERCEREEPSRTLDNQIAYEVDGYGDFITFPHCTTSRDAAAALMPIGLDVTVIIWGNSTLVRVSRDASSAVEFLAIAQAKTEPMARCAAALKTRAALAERIQASDARPEGTSNPSARKASP